MGTQVRYELTRRADGRPVLLRTGGVIGGANEGAAKVTNIQSQLGRRPILAAGNSAGDREMLEWALPATDLAWPSCSTTTTASGSSPTRACRAP